MEPLPINATLTLPPGSLTWSASRASGPGGQNVNKVSSKVELRFDPEASPLDEETKRRLRVIARSTLDAEGRVVVTSQRTREQPRNLEDAREKLREMVARALERPKPRRATRPTRGSVKRRIEDKIRVGQKKTARRDRGE